VVHRSVTAVWGSGQEPATRGIVPCDLPQTHVVGQL
jgi:hypothetical protein